MSATTIVELPSESLEGFGDAVAKGMASAERVYRIVRSMWIDSQKVILEEGQPPRFCVSLKMSVDRTV